MTDDNNFSEEELILLQSLLERIEEKNLSLLEHPGELKSMWDIIAKIESTSVLAFDKNYSEKMDRYLKNQWDAKLIPVDLKNIDTKEKLLALISEGMNFPEYFGKNWDALSECLDDYCKENYVIALFNNLEGVSKIDGEIKVLKNCIDDFNENNEFKIELIE